MRDKFPSYPLCLRIPEENNTGLTYFMLILTWFIFRNNILPLFLEYLQKKLFKNNLNLIQNVRNFEQIINGNSMVPLFDKKKLNQALFRCFCSFLLKTCFYTFSSKDRVLKSLIKSSNFLSIYTYHTDKSSRKTCQVKR